MYVSVDAEIEMCGREVIVTCDRIRRKLASIPGLATSFFSAFTFLEKHLD